MNETAPDYIYLQWPDDGTEPGIDVTWCTVPIHDSDIKYKRIKGKNNAKNGEESPKNQENKE